MVLLMAAMIALFLRRTRRGAGRRSGHATGDAGGTGASTRPHRARVPTRSSWPRSDTSSDPFDAGDGDLRIEDLPAARVQHVIDGDTVIVSTTWRKTKVRLASIDCPEDGQPWGNIATAGLIKMIGGRTVHLEEHGEDHHGRLLATLYVQDGDGSGWLNVNERMVAKGHAWVMRMYYDHLSETRKSKLNRLERWARRKKVGLWGTSNPVPPWAWRKSGRAGQQGR
jgi:endonuclease YncB( thermonuclease family)